MRLKTSIVEIPEEELPDEAGLLVVVFLVVVVVFLVVVVVFLVVVVVFFVVVVVFLVVVVVFLVVVVVVFLVVVVVLLVVVDGFFVVDDELLSELVGFLVVVSSSLPLVDEEGEDVVPSELAVVVGTSDSPRVASVPAIVVA